MMFSLVLEIAIGVITAWAGGLGNIPPGWHLCDGTEGTPDLRYKFILAAGPTFSVGDQSPTVKHRHDLTTDGHWHRLMYGSLTLSGDAAASPFSTTDTDTAQTTLDWHLPPYYALAYIQYLGG